LLALTRLGCCHLLAHELTVLGVASLPFNRRDWAPSAGRPALARQVAERAFLCSVSECGSFSHFAA